MYKIIYGSDVLYDPRSADHHVLEPMLTLGANIAGSAQLTLLKSHPRYNTPQILQPVMEVLDGDEVLFRGRIIMQEKLSIFDEKRLTAEGMLACLNDSVIEPFEFPAVAEADEAYQAAAATGNVVQYFLQWILDQHNAQVSPAQQLKLGNVTVTDPNNYISRSNENYATSWELVKDKLFESNLGGYMYCRYESTGTYVDYVDSFAQTAAQDIRFAENLVNITQSTDGSTTYSMVLPLGAKDDESGKRLTMEDLPDGDVTVDIVKEGRFLYSKAAVQNYGRIVAPVSETTFDDITLAENLQARGAAILAQFLVKMNVGTTVQAVDLHFTQEQIRAFRPYQNVLVSSAPNGINTSLAAVQITYNLADPLASLLQLGKTERTLTGANNKQNMDTDRVIGSVQKDVQGLTDSVTQIDNRVTEQSTSIIQDAQQIITTALLDYEKTSDAEQFRQSIQTSMSIMAGQIEYNFTTQTDRINNLDGDVQRFFNEQAKYIRFDNGDIVLGEAGNEIILTLENDRVSFTQDGLEVAYFANQKMYITSAEFANYIQIGQFRWIKEANGSLSLVKVG